MAFNRCNKQYNSNTTTPCTCGKTGGRTIYHFKQTYVLLLLEDCSMSCRIMGEKLFGKLSKHLRFIETA